MKKNKSNSHALEIHVEPVFTWASQPGAKVSFQTEDPILDRPSGMDDDSDWIMVAITEEGYRVLSDLVQMPPILNHIAMQFVEHLLGHHHAMMVSYSELHEMGIIENKI